MHNTHLGIWQQVLSIRSVRIPGTVPGCEQAKMSTCCQDYPATPCAPAEKINPYHLACLV